MRPFARLFIVSLAVGAGVALILGGCQGAPGGNGSGHPPAVSPSVVGTEVTATETEYAITLSTSTFTAGVYTFDVENHGTMQHNLTIAGPGVAQQSSPTEQGGGSGQITVTLQKGTYELWCSIDGHKDLGMDLKIRVT